jgi:putative serine protease PepD
MSEYTHRYGDHEQTSVLPPLGGTPDAPPPPRSRGRKASAGLLLAALVLGGAGGVAGAAGYDAMDDEPAQQSSSTTPALAPLDTRSEADDGSDTPPPSGSVEAVAAAVLPAVVKIDVVGEGGTGGSGSGVVISADGEILTNNHVVDAAGGAGRISVSFDDGSTASATVVGTDPVTDLAVIQAEDVSGLTAAAIGDSGELGVGQAVVAVGSPFGLEATVTSGIVSSLNRPVTVSGGGNGDATIYPAIQTDAAINPGNSGGPLVNMAGEVVGINSSIRTSSSGLGSEGGSIGLGFAIPISKVLPIVEQLRNDETPTHARLGVTVADSVGEDGLVTGAGIESVNDGSSGDAAGLQPGDVVTKVNDEPITSTESLIATIRGYRPGDEVSLTVVRDGDTVTLDATLDSDLEGSD